MSSRSRAKIDKDPTQLLFTAFDRNYPITLDAVYLMFSGGGAGWSPKNVQRRLEKIGAKPAYERVDKIGRAWTRWWWPYDVACAMWGEDVAARIVRQDHHGATEEEAAVGVMMPVCHEVP